MEILEALRKQVDIHCEDRKEVEEVTKLLTDNGFIPYGIQYEGFYISIYTGKMFSTENHCRMSTIITAKQFITSNTTT